jgi:uncharacterized protein
LFATEACNFRCTYCYEDFALGRMRPHVVSGVRKLISARAAELGSLEIAWFGGEPMLAKRVVFEISRHAQAEASRCGFELRSHMTTNGYFLDEPNLLELTAAGVRGFQVSLDGAAESHDRSRRHANGSPTFERIWANLRAIRRSSLPVEVVLRLHISPDNLPGVEALIDLVNREFAGDDRFAVSFNPIEHLGGPNDATTPTFEAADAARVAEKLQGQVRGLRRRESDLSCGAYVCYAAKPNSLAIRADGRISKCTVALRDERNCVGTLRADGTLELDQERLRYWFRGWQTLNEAELACPA